MTEEGEPGLVRPDHALGMELHGDEPVPVFIGFHNPVRGMGRHPHARRDPVHRLMVEGIDSQGVLAEEPVQDTSLLHTDPV